MSLLVVSVVLFGLNVVIGASLLAYIWADFDSRNGK